MLEIRTSPLERIPTLSISVGSECLVVAQQAALTETRDQTRPLSRRRLISRTC